ncbi:gluconokinase [Microbacterium sp. AGC85]
MNIVVMGVSGCGKSTVGSELAAKLHVAFVDADSLHPASNIEKMAAGIPLTDDDRWPWLDEVGLRLLAGSEPGIVIACSALRRSYRDWIRQTASGTVFIHLDGSREILAERMALRPGHFMPLSLLDSQIATLEPLEPDEAGLVLNIDATAEALVDDALAYLSTTRAGPTASPLT